ncbi:MAG: PilZ domain-containing protein [Actinomycetota bacterium]
MLSIAEKSRRRAERISTQLPVRVEAHETQNKIWREVTHLKSVSKMGADFYLNRLFVIGQLLFLTIPLDKILRRYDHDAEQYCVWGIVRHCHQISVGKSNVYHIGVAFIGKEPPFSYRKTPSAIYQFREIKKNGFWEICEDDQLVSTRKQPRYSIPIEVYIAVLDAEENIIAHEKTVTENISAGGAAVFSSLEIKIGDKVQIIKQHGNFSAMAMVRNRRIGKDNLPRIHLEFIDARFPLDGIG